MRSIGVTPVAAFVVLTGATAAYGQTPRVPPQAGFDLHDERPVDRFVVQRWVNRDMPEVSPAGFCDCIVVVYEGAEVVLEMATGGGILEVERLQDVTGDERAELVVRTYSGGAHCCEATTIYAIEERRPRSLLEISTDNCQSELIDLNQDGIAELRTCDDTFAYAFCAFAFSPLPPVVYTYDRERGQFRLATPAFASQIPLQPMAETRAALAEHRGDAALTRCVALRPALDLMYTGRIDEGRRLFRSLYRARDAAAVERKALEMMRSSRHWSPGR